LEGTPGCGNISRFPRSNPAPFLPVKSWAVDPVTDLERGGRLERVKPIFSSAILCRAMFDKLFCLLPMKPRRGWSSDPGEKGEPPREVKPMRVAVSG
jgi:hypothetical protein